MATFVSGNGGYITVTVPSGAPVRLDIKKWTLKKTSKNVENTHSGTPSTNFEHVVPHYEWDVEVPIDITNFPDAATLLREGTKATITFYLGTSGKFDVLSNTLVQDLSDVDDNSEDILRTTVTGKGGTLTQRAA